MVPPRRTAIIEICFRVILIGSPHRARYHYRTWCRGAERTNTALGGEELAQFPDARYTASLSANVATSGSHGPPRRSSYTGVRPVFNPKRVVTAHANPAFRTSSTVSGL